MAGATKTTYFRGMKIQSLEGHLGKRGTFIITNMVIGAIICLCGIVMVGVGAEDTRSSEFRLGIGMAIIGAISFTAALLVGWYLGKTNRRMRRYQKKLKEKRKKYNQPVVAVEDVPTVAQLYGYPNPPPPGVTGLPPYSYHTQEPGMGNDKAMILAPPSYQAATDGGFVNNAIVKE